ncbi:MAG: O-antigen ligase family protein [Clostridia bacterium]|nr:O-antigen ligase family protein [Clostridia bacterium]
MLSKEKVKKLLNLQIILTGIVLFFFAGFILFSVFAEKRPYNYITIVLASMMIISIIVYLIKYGSFQIDLFSYLLVAFIIIVFISQIVNGLLLSFPKNIVLVPAMAFFIYQFTKSLKNKEIMFYAILIAGVIFSGFFVIKYHSEIVSMSFSSRIGSEISDQNYLGEFFALFSIISLSFIFKSKNKILMFIAIPFSILFFALMLYTGSISNMLTTLFVACTASIFFTKGRKKLFIVIGVIIAIVLFIVLLQFDFMSYFKTRIENIFNTFVSGNGGIDNSSAFRFEFILNGLRLFAKAPLFGFGYYMTAHFSATSGSFTHNNIAELLGCHGIFSLIVFEVLMILPLIKESKKNPRVFTSILFITLFQLFLVQYNKKIEYVLLAIAFSFFQINYIPSFEIKFVNKKITFARLRSAKFATRKYYEVYI